MNKQGAILDIYLNKFEYSKHYFLVGQKLEKRGYSYLIPFEVISKEQQKYSKVILNTLKKELNLNLSFFSYGFQDEATFNDEDFIKVKTNDVKSLKNKLYKYLKDNNLLSDFKYYFKINKDNLSEYFKYITIDNLYFFSEVALKYIVNEDEIFFKKLKVNYFRS